MKFLKRFEASFHSRTGAYIFYALTAAAFFFLLSAAEWASWIAELYPLGERFVPTLLAAIGGCAVVNLGFLLAAKKLNRHALRTIHSIFCVLAGILFGYTLVLNFGLDAGLRWDRVQNGITYLLPNLPYLSLALGLPFAFVLYPALKKTARLILAVLISAAIALPLILIHFLPQEPFAMRTNPLVLDIGGGSYSVVFATNRESTAYVRYIFEGEEFTVADAFAGRMNIGRVHSFKVPREHLNGNSYHVIAREVLSSIDSGTEYGAAIKSPAFQFKGDYKEDLNILMAADWHDQPKKLLAAASNFPEPDLFIMLGDAASFYNTEDEFIINTIAAGADVTKSEIPAVYARGNHEIYGKMTEIIFPGLGLDSFYYQVRRGGYLFTICDGADWSGDRIDFSEYVRGSTNSENDVYREEQLDWLASLEPGDEAFHFSALHIPDFGNEAQRDRFYSELGRLGIDLQFAGNEHALYLDEMNAGRYAAPYPLFIAGGPKDGSYGGIYVCSMAQVNAADGTLRLLAYDSANEKLMDEKINIKGELS